VRIAICEDNLSSIESLKESISRWRTSKLVQTLSVDAFSSSEDFFEEIMKSIAYDLIFLDIEFPGEWSGMQLAAEIRKKDQDVLIVFLTNYDSYAIEGYQVSALRYFQKPFRDEQIFVCLDIAYRRWRFSKTSCVLSNQNNAYKVNPYEVLYVETQGHYATLHMDGQEDLRLRMKLKDIQNHFPAKMFAVCQQSYMVNLLYIKKITKKYVEMINGEMLPVSPRYWDTMYEAFLMLNRGDDNGNR